MGEAGSKHVSRVSPTRSTDVSLTRGCSAAPAATSVAFAPLRCVCCFARVSHVPLRPSLTNTHLWLAKPHATRALVRCTLRSPSASGPFPKRLFSTQAVSHCSHTDSNLRALRNAQTFGWRNHVQPVHPCVVHCAPQALAVRSQNGSFQHNCPVRHCSHTGLNPVYCAKAHLPDSPPPFFLCAWATPLRGTSVTLGRRAHSPDKQVGMGWETSRQLIGGFARRSGIANHRFEPASRRPE